MLGLAVAGLGDVVSLELTKGPTRIASITGRDADLVPRDPARNAAAIAARAWFERAGEPRSFTLRIRKGLPVSGGLGGSAASSVAGALAAALATGQRHDRASILDAAFAGESAVAGRHLDNVAACVLGGLTLVRSLDPIDVVALPVNAKWWVVLFTPGVRIETKAARKVLPQRVGREVWVPQMANTLALAHAFATGDGALLSRALDDHFAEPARARLIPRFAEVKAAALAAGAFGCSISGSGPTMFALDPSEAVGRRCAAAMRRALGRAAPSRAHVGRIARRGAHAK
ncbi:MAG: homoserine kinase [Planctomycetes bacterium]|nr:homoserine kinase [Planctomycetota bacterium]